MRKSLLATALGLVSLVCILPACGGSSGSLLLPANFTGTWNVRYNFLEQGCLITFATFQGIVDQHLISRNDAGAYEFLSVGQVINADSVTTPDDATLLASQSDTGDIFNDGSICTLDQTISYTTVDTETAETLYTRKIICNDGFSCETRALGTAERVPYSEQG